jgi:UDPglucose 6-dehydrogenase
MKNPSIGVIGLGFVGLTLAVVNAKKGFNTIAMDVNKTKIENYKKSNLDFFEPKLDYYSKQSIKKKKIFFTNNFEDISKADIIFVTVGTPSLKNGQINLSNLKSVILKLKKLFKNKKSKHLIVIKSTVIPTTTSNIIFKELKLLKNIGLVVNPEFLREGSAIDDLLTPHLIVIGSRNKKDANKLEDYYKLFYKKKIEIIKTDFSSAELIKYTNNAFLATKISFINSIANICQNIPNTDVNIISKAIGKDSRIGPLFLQAGAGFGGSCLPKDLNALINYSKKFDNVNSLFTAVKEVNDLQPKRIISLMKKDGILSKNKTVSILGLSFKKNTDDIRESISIKLVNHLLKHELEIKVHDPMAINNFKKIFSNKISYFNDVNECVKNSDCCIILTDWDEYKKLKVNDFKKMKEKTIIDGRRILDATKFSSCNFKAIGLGN